MQLKRTLALGFLAATALACTSAAISSFGGGDVQPTPLSPGIDEPGPGPGSTGAFAQSTTSCPAALPSQGSDCTTEQRCEYGHAADQGCNTIIACVGFRWALVQAASVCRGQCGAYSDRQDGDPCSDTELCTWPEGTCGCVASGADDGGPDAAISGTWRCATPAEGCPAERPLEGTACVKPMNCDYGSCLFFGVPLSYTCSSGTWQTGTLPFCP